MIEVKKVIVNLRNSMVKDNQNLNTAFINTYESYLVEPITYLMNLSIQTSRFPESRKIATITPVYKSGENDLVSNYRPIAILPVIEKIVAEQLMEHLDSNQQLYSLQFRFRPKHSTESASLYPLEKIKSSLDKGNVIVTVFLNLKKSL